MKKPAKSGLEPIVSIAEYRKLLNDQISTDEKILERLRYLESFCRTIAKMELEKYTKSPEEYTAKHRSVS